MPKYSFNLIVLATDIKKMFWAGFYSLSLFFISACGHQPLKKVIVLQPFDNYPLAEIVLVKNGLIKTYGVNIIISQKTALPAKAYYKPQSRYSADELISFLSKRKNNTVFTVMGLTDKDIFTAKGNNKYWGVMGLGTLSADAAVISTYRLHHNGDMHSELIKLAAHELGHNFGLQHCADRTCIMADAEGHSNFYRETGLCPKCKQRLTDMGIF
jgi:archaemetzincin